MTTEAEKAVYPLSSPDGKDIPFDVGLPTGLYITSISAAVSVERTLDATFEMVTFFATVPCILMFGAGVVLDLSEDVTKTDAQIVPANTPVSIKIPNVKFKVIGTSASAGKLYCQNYKRWQALTTESLQRRIG